MVSGLNDAKDCNLLGTEAWLEILHGKTTQKFRVTTPTQGKVSIGYIIVFYQAAVLLSCLTTLN